MNANNDAHIARLEDLLTWSAKDGDRPALRAAIRALSADRGEAVPIAWADPASMQGYTLGASAGFAAGDKSGSRNTPLYLHPPSADLTGCRVPHYKHDPCHNCDSPDTAPSQVSDADRAWRFSARELLRELTLSLSVNGARMTIDNDALRSIDLRARHLLTGQPQPGRVEGVDTWFVSGSRGWPGGIEFRSRDEAIAHIREHDGRLHFWIHQANRKDYTREEVAAMIAAAPTAGGDA